jgi:hypothetical protein
MLRISKRIAIAVAAVAATLVAASARADLAKWDQAQVTKIAQDLAPAADGWWEALRRQPAMVGDAMDESSLLGKARVLKEMTASLADQLKKGDGRDKTLDQYKSIGELRDDTVVRMQQAALDEPTMDAWAKVAAAMRQIAPYYDPNANAGK